MIGLILLTLVLLNNTTYPGGTLDVIVEGNGTLNLPENCTYFCDSYKNSINVSDGNYTICVSYSCKPGNYSIIANGYTYNFTVLKPDYNYLLNSTIKLESERNRLISQVKNLSDTVRKLKEENENLTAELKEYMALVDSLEEENDVLKKTVKDLQDKISYLEDRINLLERDKSNLEYAFNFLQKLYYYSKLALAFIFAFVVGAYVAIVRR